MSWVNNTNCNILNSCINSQNIPDDGGTLENNLLNNWPGVVAAYNQGGCSAVRNLVGLQQSACQQNTGLYFSGCPEGPNTAPRGSIISPVCILPGATCDFNPQCSSSESYVNVPWARPSAYVNLNRTWGTQKPFQL